MDNYPKDALDVDTFTSSTNLIESKSTYRDIDRSNGKGNQPQDDDHDEDFFILIGRNYTP